MRSTSYYEQNSRWVAHNFMEFMPEVDRGCCDSREEEEEEEAAEILTREESSSKHYFPFSSPSSSSPSATNYQHSGHDHHHHIINIPHQQNPWLGKIHDHHQSPEATITTIESHNSSSSGLGLHQQQDAPSDFINHRKQLNFMDLSLGNSNNNDAIAVATGHATASSSSNNEPTEKEHMFDKVVTPSDVGKLNRLVIPKQHAEKYFPLDSTSNEKGLLLNFEDRNGKLWRFRYSYWNSSQSYVMTKGWSRFVKEKKLDAGDIVSFQRGVGELYRHRLYIDWRRRPDHGPDHPSAALIAPFFLPNQPHLSPYSSIRWGGRLYSLPSPPPRHHDHFPQLNYNNMYPFHHQQQHHYNYNEMNLGSGSTYYLRSTPSIPGGHQSNLTRQQEEGGNNIAPMIIDSVPISHHHHHHSGNNSGPSSGSASTAGKRLRLFGVNMECASSSTSESHVTMANSLPSSSLPQPLQLLRVPHDQDPHSSSTRFGDQGRETSMLFDLDPSLQYRQ